VHRALKIKLLIILIFLSISIYSYSHVFHMPEAPAYSYSLFQVFITSICFGVIISASIYNFTLFIYNRDIQYLYYSLAQASTLLFLFALDSIYITPFDKIIGLDNHMFFDLYQHALLLFSILFLEKFFHTKQNSITLHKIINIIKYFILIDIILTIILSHAIFIRLIPIFIPIWLILSESHRLIKDKNLSFYFIYLGWAIPLTVAIAEYMGIIAFINKEFPFLHIAFALESLILSLAISYKFKLIEDAQKAQQSLLLQQSRLASMGEMIATIAHQWRQPLTHLSYIFMNIKKSADNKTLIEKKIAEGKEQLKYMSKTIDDFRNFYNPSKIKEAFNIKEACNEAIKIAMPTLRISHIKITLKENNPCTIIGNLHELSQAILNIINNARDILIERSIKEPFIHIKIDTCEIKISDNGKGIKKENIEKIFEPYFSTKTDSDGIGLYISKTIIEKEMGGKLILKSDKNGTTFTIKIPFS